MPTRENQTHRERQEGVRKIITEYWQCEVHTLPRFSRLDFLLERDGVGFAFAELKTSNAPIGKFSTIFVDADKLIAAHTTTEATGLPVFLVVAWQDFCGYVPFTREPTDGFLCVNYGGTRKRGDIENDMQAVAHYEPGRFIPLWSRSDVLKGG
jgi:hypothetical protein